MTLDLNASASIVTILGLPVTALLPPVGLLIHSLLQAFRPKSKYKKWVIRVQQVSAVLASIEDDSIPKEELEKFLELLQL